MQTFNTFSSSQERNESEPQIIVQITNPRILQVYNACVKLLLKMFKNQICDPWWNLSNAILHAQFQGQIWLLF